MPKHLPRKLFQDTEFLLQSCKTFRRLHQVKDKKSRFEKSKINLQVGTIWDPLKKSCAQKRRLHGRRRDLPNLKMASVIIDNISESNAACCRPQGSRKDSVSGLIVEKETREADFKAAVTVRIQSRTTIFAQDMTSLSHVIRPRGGAIDGGGARNLPTVAIPAYLQQLRGLPEL